jgi:hypothetical protein
VTPPRFTTEGGVGGGRPPKGAKMAQNPLLGSFPFKMGGVGGGGGGVPKNPKNARYKRLMFFPGGA